MKKMVMFNQSQATTRTTALNPLDKNTIQHQQKRKHIMLKLKLKNSTKALALISSITFSPITHAATTTSVQANIYGAIMAAIAINYTPTQTEIDNWSALDDAIKMSLSNSVPIGLTKPYSRMQAICALQKQIKDPSIEPGWYNFEGKTSPCDLKNPNPPGEITGAEPFSSKTIDGKQATSILNSLADARGFEARWLDVKKTPTSGQTGPQVVKNLFDTKAYKKIAKDPLSSAYTQIQNYISQYKSSSTVRAIALSAMNQLLQEKIKNPKDKKVIDASAQIQTMVEPEALKIASPLTVAKDQLLVLAQIEKQNKQAHLDRERNTALMSVLILQMNDLASSNIMMEKNQIQKIFKDAKKN
jgi:hypothetical protein